MRDILKTDIHRTIEAVWKIESIRLIAGIARVTRDIHTPPLDLVVPYAETSRRFSAYRSRAGYLVTNTIFGS